MIGCPVAFVACFVGFWSDFGYSPLEGLKGPPKVETDSSD